MLVNSDYLQGWQKRPVMRCGVVGGQGLTEVVVSYVRKAPFSNKNAVEGGAPGFLIECGKQLLTAEQQ
jgi:hypothetical protein